MTERHERVAELLGVYALGAVNDVERRLVESHIVGCPACAAEVAEHLETVDLLGRGHRPEGQRRSARISATDRERYLTAARGGDEVGATTMTLDLLEEGVALDVVVEGLLAEAQRETGLRWLQNVWTVGEEQVATSTTAAVVDVLGHVSDMPGDRGNLAVVCAEGDRHALPSRMFAERMRQRGWSVTFLGAGISADRLGDRLRRGSHDALAITCSIPLTFAGAARFAEVAHGCDLPALIGGAGIAPNPVRALALGADGLATTPDDADALVRTLVGEPRAARPTRVPADALALDAGADAYADASLPGLERAFPAMRDYDERRRLRTREDLSFIVRFVAAALLVGDRSVWTDFAAWQLALLSARGVPERAFAAGLEVLAEQLRHDHPAAAQLLDDHLSGTA